MDAPTLDLRTTLLVRALPSGDRLVAPVCDLALASHGTEAHCLAEQRVFLTEHLARIAPEAVAGFALPEALRLETVDVVIPRDDLPRRAQVRTPIAVTSVVVPTREGDAWVVVVAMDHVFYVPRGEDLRAAIRGEVQRLSGARQMDPWEYLRLLPARGYSLVPMDLEIARPERLPAGRLASLRKALVDRQRRARATEVLESVAVPLHARLPRRSASLVGRDSERRGLAAVLDGRARLSALVVGPILAGKTAVIHGWLRERLARDPGVTVWATSGAQLIAGMSGLGQWEERVRRVMEAVETLDGVLYFDNLGDLLTDHADTSRGGVDLPAALKPWLEDGRVRVIAELRADLMDALERWQSALVACFNRVRVEALAPGATADALRAAIAHDRRHPSGRARLRDDAVQPLVDLAERYLPYQSFPGKAFRLYDDLRALRERDRSAPLGRGGAGDEVPEITAEDVHEGFSVQSGIPAFLLRDDRALELESVVRDLQRRVVGQDEAVRRVAETVCVVKARLQPAGRPLAVLLFVGPTGVGKTELARATTALLFGSGDRMVRFDMSEFTGAEAADRLIRGTDSAEGLLTRKVREQPFCVLLLDEIEKAHPAVFDLLLQVCGEGRLTDGRGRTAYFHNAIIVMTSNLGVAHRRDAAGFTPVAGTAEGYYAREVDRTFRPEFVNRLDRIVAFQPLAPVHVRAVAVLALDRIRTRQGLSEGGIALTVSDAALATLVAGGCSTRYGARALRRHLEDHLVAPVARLLSALGRSQSPVAVQVTRADEDPLAQPPGTVPAGTASGGGDGEAGGLRVEVFRARSTASAQETRGLDRIAALRREVDATLALHRAVELRERLDLLVTQLNYGRGADDRATAQEIAAQQTEHHRLSTVWDRVAVAQSEVHALEELALLAVLEHAGVDGFVGEARAVEQRFRRELAYLLVAMEPRRDQVTLLLTELDDQRGMDLWLKPLLAAAPARGWTAWLHVDGGARSPSDEWPAERRWGPPRDAERLLAELEDPDRGLRNVLLRCTGTWAGALLAPEAGLHVWEGGGLTEAARLYIRRLGMSATVADRRWTRHRDLVPPNAVTAAELRRQPVVRATDFTEGTVEVPGGRTVTVGDGYFTALEEITAAHLLRYEEDGAPDRAEVFVGPLDFPDAEGEG